MFAFLRGTVARKGVDRIELDVNGVGYQVFVPELVSRKLVADGTVTLLTYCYIREDAFQIYGFLREEERALFKTLLAVGGIGPKTALAVLSAMSVPEFGRAILESDVKAFSKVSGIGKKTAQRVVLEMKAKLGQDAELSAILGEREAEASPETDDVLAALCALGCTVNEARRAAAHARKQLGDGATDVDLVKAALQSLRKV